MEITIYTDSLSVDKAFNQVRVTVNVDVEDMLTQLNSVPKNDYTILDDQYETLRERFRQVQEAYDELREKFDMLDP
jgi:hypothetical protein